MKLRSHSPKTLRHVLLVALLAPLAAAAGPADPAGDAAKAQLIGNGRLSGTIFDVTAANTTPAGPWLVSGDWTARTRRGSHGASFNAVLNMVRSDQWVVASAGDFNDPAARSAHVHRIALSNGTFTQTDTSLTISGDAEILVDGSPASFSPAPVMLEISGGTTTGLARAELTFGGGATAHFGTDPLAGSVALYEPGTLRERD
jgi:hypothetical protein